MVHKFKQSNTREPNKPRHILTGVFFCHIPRVLLDLRALTGIATTPQLPRYEAAARHNGIVPQSRRLMDTDHRSDINFAVAIRL